MASRWLFLHPSSRFIVTAVPLWGSALSLTVPNPTAPATSCLLFLSLEAWSPTHLLLPRSSYSLKGFAPSPGVSAPSSHCPLTVPFSSHVLLPQNSARSRPPYHPALSLCPLSHLQLSLLFTELSLYFLLMLLSQKLLGPACSYKSRSLPTVSPRGLIVSWPACGLAALDQVPSHGSVTCGWAHKAQSFLSAGTVGRALWHTCAESQLCYEFAG